jgi:ATP-dependent DNA helicase RecG
MPKPFRDIDPVTLGRRDDPPGFRVFREASVNLLIHQDYGDHSRKAVIKFFRDGIQFWNPGDVFGDDSRLFEPGEKEVRNPAIAMAMRRIAMCEQAGTGMRMMREEWQKLGHPAPTYKNDRAWKAFELFIPELDKEVDMASDLMRAMFGATDQVGSKSGPIRDQVTGKVTGEDVRQVPDKYPTSNRQVTRQEVSVLQAAVNPASRSVLQQISGLRDREHFMDSVLKPLLDNGLLEMTIPDKPRSSKQKYRLTEKGRKLIQDSKIKIQD